jgi:hypothetical protein
VGLAQEQKILKYEKRKKRGNEESLRTYKVVEMSPGRGVQPRSS